MKRSTYTVLVLAMTLALGQSWAQADPTDEPSAEDSVTREATKHHRGAESSQRRQRALDAIRKTRGQRLTERLKLTPQQTAVLTTLNRFDDELFALAREGRKLRRQGRQAAESQDQSELRRITEAVLKLRSRRVAFEERRFRAVAKHLSPEQAAEAVNLLPRLDRQIGRAVGRVLERRRGAKDR